jgi:hypothetical protein
MRGTDPVPFIKEGAELPPFIRGFEGDFPLKGFPQPEKTVSGTGEAT